MKIGVILNRVNFEEKEIIIKLKERGHKVIQFNNQRLKLNFNALFNNEVNDFSDVDIVLQRSLSLVRGLYSSAVLESAGIKVINDYNSLHICGDKILTSLKLFENNIPTPKSGIAFKKNSSLELIEELTGYPSIIKPPIGSWGRLIAKLDNKNMATAILEDRETMGHIFQKVFYIQDYIGPDQRPEDAPTDIRVIFLGGKCVAAMGRITQSDDFRSNIALGAKGIPLKIDNEMESICKKIADSVGGEFLGIDLMQTKKGYTCLEVNGCPQFKGMSKASNLDIAQQFIEYLEETYA
ncbi:MAG: RimK family alpha-L-glutamate ligase [Candidatus Lokiarchaeota archaeon]|nr:RimK family alpha-L-glutamate ligase [Candidatus Lokiarchaeota archaeon]